MPPRGTIIEAAARLNAMQGVANRPTGIASAAPTEVLVTPKAKAIPGNATRITRPAASFHCPKDVLPQRATSPLFAPRKSLESIACEGFA